MDYISMFAPSIVEKGWGREIVIDNNDKYCGKLLEFKKGSEFSFHYHMEKDETFYVLMGELNFGFIDLSKAEYHTKVLKQGQCVRIPRGQPHKIRAEEDSIIIEVSTHHEDSDSYRIGKGDSQ